MAMAVAHECYGVDTVAHLTAQTAGQLRKANYRGNPIEFVIRYVSLGPEGGWDLTAQEVQEILNEDLALLVVQRVRMPGWIPSAERGTSDGQNAVKNAKAVGYSPGCHIIIDIEGVLPGTSAETVVEHINACAREIVSGGYLAMVYVGYNTMLTAQQLYEDLPDVHAYFSDFGAREVAKRGFCIKQLAGNVSLPGVPFWVDPDRIMADNEGGYPMWMIKDTKEAA